jgi:hypothetical protein
MAVCMQYEVVKACISVTIDATDMSMGTVPPLLDLGRRTAGNDRPGCNRNFISFGYNEANHRFPTTELVRVP